MLGHGLAMPNQNAAVAGLTPAWTTFDLRVFLYNRRIILEREEFSGFFLEGKEMMQKIPKDEELLYRPQPDLRLPYFFWPPLDREALTPAPHPFPLFLVTLREG